MNTVFLDTVGLLALWDASDQWHEAAEEAFAKLQETKPALVTTTLVLLECGNAAARRPLSHGGFRDIVLRSWPLRIQAGYKLTTFKEDEINLETAFMALTKGITA